MARIKEPAEEKVDVRADQGIHRQRDRGVEDQVVEAVVGVERPDVGCIDDYPADERGTFRTGKNHIDLPATGTARAAPAQFRDLFGQVLIFAASSTVAASSRCRRELQALGQLSVVAAIRNRVREKKSRE